MNAVQLTPLAAEGFSVVPRVEKESISVALSGAAQLNAHLVLGPYLTALHKECLRGNVTQVRVDLTQLNFMNSSCLKHFVTWVANVKDAGSYRIIFVTNTALRWQRACLAALRGFAPDHIDVE
jgi:hypothetical protein